MGKRTANCGELSKEDTGKEVILMGWVNRSRDHGGLIFVDLRDRSGIVQIVFDPEEKEAYEKAKSLRSEFVVAAKGKVRKRPAETENPNLKTGEIEVYAREIEVMNPSKTPPLYISGEEETAENVRLRYRYLDLRRERMKKNIILRYRITKAVRDFLDSQGFIEIETPMLIKSTPEGARDFLVPSRFYPGKFFALPQSPQLFKQLLMVAGFEKYFQIARCFRDEDLRADRQPEFTQIDLEMSFVDEDEIFLVTENMLKSVFDKVLKIKLKTPFPNISYKEAMESYGTDKPDPRFGLKLVDISSLVSDCSFKVFKEVIDEGGKVKGMNVKGGGKFSRKDIDELTRWVNSLGAKGLAYFFVEEELKSPILKFFSEEEKKEILKKMEAERGDLLLFIADQEELVNKVLAALRLELAKRLNLFKERTFQFVWVTSFPLLEYSDEEKKLVSSHHPFTAPCDEDLHLLEKEPLKVRAKAYDLILNGVEVGGGSIRIHKREVQERVFKVLGLKEEEVKEKFGFLLEAFEYGAPPHGGIAPGLDRLVRIIAGEEDIREVIAFPKTQSGSCPLTQAPYRVSEKQLKELRIKTI